MARTLIIATITATALLAGCGNPAPRNTFASTGATTPATTTAAGPAPAGPESHVLELEVTGTAALSSLTFTLDGHVSAQDAAVLPWRKTISIPSGTGSHEFQLTMHYSGGTLSATANLDGQPLSRTGGAGPAGSDNTAGLGSSFQS
jgi:hypothetical protein